MNREQRRRQRMSTRSGGVATALADLPNHHLGHTIYSKPEEDEVEWEGKMVKTAERWATQWSHDGWGFFQDHMHIGTPEDRQALKQLLMSGHLLKLLWMLRDHNFGIEDCFDTWRQERWGVSGEFEDRPYA